MLPLLLSKPELTPHASAILLCRGSAVAVPLLFWLAEILARSQFRMASAGFAVAAVSLTIAAGWIGLKSIQDRRTPLHYALLGALLIFFVTPYGESVLSPLEDMAVLAFISPFSTLLLPLLYLLPLAAFALGLGLLLRKLGSAASSSPQPPRLVACLMGWWGFALGHAMACLFLLATLSKNSPVQPTQALGIGMVPSLAGFLLLSFALRTREHARPPPAIPVQAPPTSQETRQAQQKAVHAPQESPHVAITASLAAAVLACLLFWQAHSALNQSEPNASLAAGLHAATLLVTAAGGWAAMARLEERRRRLLWSLLVALPTFLIADQGATTYDADSLSGIFRPLEAAFKPILLLLALATILAAALTVSSARASKSSILFVGGWGFALGHSLASIHILATLPQQVEASRIAHSSPGGGWAVLATALLAAAFLRRQRSP